MSKSKVDSAEQVKFLVSCIGHTANGRPDFAAVAEELGIVTKAAAQKRYERMLKAHNVSRPTGNDSPGGTPAKSSPMKRAKASGADESPLKRRATARAAKTAAAAATVKQESDDSSGDSKPMAKPRGRGRPASAAKTPKATPKSESSEDGGVKAEMEQKDNDEDTAAAADAGADDADDKHEDSELSSPPSSEQD